MIVHRPRRLRQTPAIRSLVQETRLHPKELILPLFVLEGNQRKEAINSLPGVFRLSLDLILKDVEEILKWGICAVALFPIIPKESKDPEGSEALNPKGILQKAITTLKTAFPELCVIADVALDPYTTHGHDGLIDSSGTILNDPTIERLQAMALIQAEAGVDMVAPSDMMDGRVLKIREALDGRGYEDVLIHAYSAKFASSFYGPYRDAVNSQLQFGNKKTYQLNPANQREALFEAFLDQNEGADILMVKPALAYLDIICKFKEQTHLPVSAYQVSGEYAMIKAAAEKGWINETTVLLESLLCIKRAGASMIFTYGALEAAKAIKSGVLD